MNAVDRNNAIIEDENRDKYNIKEKERVVN